MQQKNEGRIVPTMTTAPEKSENRDKNGHGRRQTFLSSERKRRNGCRFDL